MEPACQHRADSPVAGVAGVPAEAGAAGPAFDQRSTHPAAAGQANRPGRPLLRRHVLVGVRHRADPAHPGSDRRTGRVRPGHPDNPGDPGSPGRGDDLLSGGRQGLSQGRRLVRGEQGQLRAQRGPDRRGRSLDQLHHHRRGLGSRRFGRHHLGGAEPAGRRRPHVGGLRGADRLGQPARPAGGGALLRHPHLLLHRQHGGPDRRRPDPGRPRQPGACADSLRPDPARKGRERPAARGVAVLRGPGVRQWRIGHDGYRGDLQRRQRLPPTPGR